MRLLAACLCVVAANAFGAASPAAPEPDGARKATARREDGPIPGYCGIYCLHAAMRLLDKDVPFDRLIKPRYVGSRQGSSVAELAAAAEDHGLHTGVLRNMTCAMLPSVDVPLLLHVRSSPAAADYDHWVLLLGTAGDRARVYDGAGDTKTIPISRLAAQWDGVGLFVSDRPVTFAPYYVAGFAGVLVVVTGFVAALVFPRLTGAALPAAARPSPLRESAALLGFAAVSTAALFVFAPSGYLCDVEYVHAIQDRKIADLAPELSADDLDALIASPDRPLVIDARQAPDFQAGHVPTAVSFPADSTATAANVREIFAPYDRSTPIVLYCQSASCDYDEHVARLLYNEGYTRLSFFGGGWVEWQETRPSGSSVR